MCGSSKKYRIYGPFIFGRMLAVLENDVDTFAPFHLGFLSFIVDTIRWKGGLLYEIQCEGDGETFCAMWISLLQAFWPTYLPRMLRAFAREVWHLKCLFRITFRRIVLTYQWMYKFVFRILCRNSCTNQPGFTRALKLGASDRCDTCWQSWWPFDIDLGSARTTNGGASLMKTLGLYN